MIVTVAMMRAAGISEKLIARVCELEEAQRLIEKATRLKKRREQTKLRVQKHRERVTHVAQRNALQALQGKTQSDQIPRHGDSALQPSTYLTSLPSVLITSLEKEERSEIVAPVAGPKYPPEFEEFYDQYPRHTGKRDAHKVWLRIKTEVTHSELIAGAMRYAADPNRDPTFTKHCATWLTKGCWSDGPLPPRGGQQNGRAKETPIEQAQRLADEWTRRERAAGIYGEADDAGSYRGRR